MYRHFLNYHQHPELVTNAALWPTLPFPSPLQVRSSLTGLAWRRGDLECWPEQTTGCAPTDSRVRGMLTGNIAVQYGAAGDWVSRDESLSLRLVSSSGNQAAPGRLTGVEKTRRCCNRPNACIWWGVDEKDHWVGGGIPLSPRLGTRMWSSTGFDYMRRSLRVN